MRMKILVTSVPVTIASRKKSDKRKKTTDGPLTTDTEDTDFNIIVNYGTLVWFLCTSFKCRKCKKKALLS